MISRYVSDLLEILRTNRIDSVTNNGTPVSVVSLDTYNEESDVVLQLSNGKKITYDDLEFAESHHDTHGTRISLGNYVFLLTR